MLAAAETRGPSRSDDEKRRMVRALDNRGDKTADQVAEQLGVSVALLYHWRKRIKNGEPLDLRAARAAGTAITKAKPAAMTTAPATRRAPAHEIVLASSPTTTRDSLTEGEHDELVRLRAENARLKAALIAGLSLQEALR